MSIPSAVELLAQRSVYMLGIAAKIADYGRQSSPAAERMWALRARFYVDVWTAAAHATGTSAKVLDGSVLTIPVGDGRLLVRSNLTSLDDHLTVALSEDKTAVNRLLEAQGIPVPRHFECRFDQLTSAWRFVSGLGTGAVIKPAQNGIGGLGVTTDVRTRSELAVAMGLGRVRSSRVLIEEMIPGDVYRLLYLDGELLDAVLRAPACVVGDGETNLRRLIERENERRGNSGIQAAQELLRVDRDLRNSLRRRGYGLSSVPAAGEVVRLKQVVNDNSREDNAPALRVVSPEVARTGAEAAAAIGLRLAGVDVMTTDPTVSLNESGGAVLEVNHGPGLYYHYMNSGPGTPIAKMILERLLRRDG